MPRPGSGSTKLTIKGTRAADTIEVVAGGVLVNGTFKAVSQAQIDGGLTIDGGAGNDTVIGGPGADTLNGGDGDDRLIDAPLGARFNGGRGIDTADFGGASAGIFVDLGSSFIDDDITVSVAGDGRVRFDGFQDGVQGAISGVENVTGSSFDDVLWGSSAANVLSGGGGTDQLVGQGGNDELFGGAGSDYLYGGTGDDQYSGGAGGDYFLFASGSAADPAEGHDAVHDYTPGEDILVFQWSQNDLVWSTTVANGQPALVGTYDGGRSEVVLLGITDPAQLTVIHADANWF